jgi:hypothetical protein
VPFDSRKLRKSMMSGRGSILVPLIESYQRQAQFPEKWQIEIRNRKDPDGFFHPSSHAFVPPSVLYQDMRGLLIHAKPSPALRRTFDCGHMWHGYIQAMLLEMGYVTKENIEHYVVAEREGKFGLFTGAGTGDLVDVQIPGHGSWLVDIKTMNKVEFEQGANPFTMKKWVAQVSCYMDWFDADRAMILAVSKDSPHDFREYQILKDVPMLQEIYDRWSYVRWCLDNDEKPTDGDYHVDPLLLNPGDSVLDAQVAEKSVQYDTAVV